MDLQMDGSMEWMKTFTIGLASQSPRRQYLLKQGGFQFRLIPNAYDEIIPPDMDPYEAPEYLAIQKARHALPGIGDCDLILAADCVVLLQGEIIGKPKDRADAIHMLTRLSGETHTVVSGVCLHQPDRTHAFSVQSSVTFSKLAPEEIEFYVDHYHPMDKAGSYGIQDWIGWNKIIRIDGSYSNIMGLPMHEVYHALHKFIFRL